MMNYLWVYGWIEVDFFWTGMVEFGPELENQENWTRITESRKLDQN
jgi:hypothetical protein